MTPTAAIPTVSLNDDHTIPVLGISVVDLPAPEAEAAVTAALAAGYRMIDTAPGDGTEEAVGRAIAASGIPRDELFVSTTLGTADQGFQASQDGCRASLARLGLDYLDLYLVDWPAEENGRYIDAWGGIMKSKEVGETRSIGVSNFNPEQLSNIIDLSFFTPAVNRVELHPLLNQSELKAVHAQYSITTVAYCPLGGGTLLEHPAVAAVAGAHGITPAQVVLRWSIQSGNVVLPRAASADDLADNLAALGVELTDAEIATLDGLDDGTVFCPGPTA